MRLASSAQGRAEQAARVRIGQHADEGVAVLFRQAAERKNLLCSRIPRQNVPTPPGDIGRLIEVIHQAPDRVRDIFAGEGTAIGIRGQSPQMGMLRLAEAQRARQRVDGGDRRTDGASLFQPDIPIDADPREFGHLLAPQTRGSTPPPGWKADRLGA
jgi:hypothetical protein